MQEIKSDKTEKREYERLLAIRDNYPKYVFLTNDFAGGNFWATYFSLNSADSPMCFTVKVTSPSFVAVEV